jgi:FKBP-type peptidyl-prolyl cis-trans isomerase
MSEDDTKSPFQGFLVFLALSCFLVLAWLTHSITEPLISRVRVEILRNADGRVPVKGDRVQIHYRGMLEDGTLFDSSYQRGTPLEFVLGYDRALEGMEQGLLQVPEGARARLHIPFGLAYKEKILSAIPPRSNLIFEVALLSIKASGLPQKIPDTYGFEEKKEDGLHYWVLKEKPSSRSPAKGEEIIVNYTGWLEDGTLFDSSAFSGKPFKFILGSKVISGWNRMLLKMRVGETVLVKIPPHLAYGDQKIKQVLPGSTLLFQIELLAIKG